MCLLKNILLYGLPIVAAKKKTCLLYTKKLFFGLPDSKCQIFRYLHFFYKQVLSFYLA